MMTKDVQFPSISIGYNPFLFMFFQFKIFTRQRLLTSAPIVRIATWKENKRQTLQFITRIVSLFLPAYNLIAIWLNGLRGQLKQQIISRDGRHNGNNATQEREIIILIVYVYIVGICVGRSAAVTRTCVHIFQRRAERARVSNGRAETRRQNENLNCKCVIFFFPASLQQFFNEKTNVP